MEMGLVRKPPRKRRLGDLQVFDDASRGPLGALRLFAGQTRSSLALIGALILILSMAFDLPFSKS